MSYTQEPRGRFILKLQSGKDAASRLYQKIAAEHIRGSRTSQGTYILTPRESNHFVTSD